MRGVRLRRRLFGLRILGPGTLWLAVIALSSGHASAEEHRVTREALVRTVERGPGPSKGRADAPITVVEFSDFRCSYCRKFWRETLPRLEREYVATGKVRFVYRHLVALGPPPRERRRRSVRPSRASSGRTTICCSSGRARPRSPTERSRSTRRSSGSSRKGSRPAWPRVGTRSGSSGSPPRRDTWARLGRRPSSSMGGFSSEPTHSRRSSRCWTTRWLRLALRRQDPGLSGSRPRLRSSGDLMGELR
jgi:hypothetical protein